MFRAVKKDTRSAPCKPRPGVCTRFNCWLSIAGLSLIELSVVVAIMGIVALVTVPNLSPAKTQQLELAANTVADALRFARSESVRTGQVHGVLIDTDGTESTTKEVTVYRVNPDDLTDFSAILYHPVRKQFHDLQLSNTRLLRGVFITNSPQPFDIQGVGRTKQVHFNAAGDPVYTQGTSSFPMLSGEIRLSNGQQTMSIVIAPITGRVTIQ